MGSRLYKPERKPPRKAGVIGQHAPISCPDATGKEIVSALAAIGFQSGIVIGRGGMYDPLKDVYVVTGKSRATGIAQDFHVDGHTVGDLIMLGRLISTNAMTI